MKNYVISEFTTQKWKLHPFLLKNECNVRLPFCSDITDISNLISVHDQDRFGVYLKLAHVSLTNYLGFHYSLKIFAVFESSLDSVIWLPVQKLGKNTKGTLIFKYKYFFWLNNYTFV